MIANHPNGNGKARATRTEQALRASELSYRRLFEAAQDGILILNFETGRIDDVNPFLATLLGFTHDDMVGKTVGELSPFRDVVSNQTMLEKLQVDGYVRYEDLPLETRDGRNIAVEFVSNVYEAGDNKVIQCNVRDITERKKNQEVLRDSAKMQASILNALPAQIALIDREGVIVSVNEAWRQFAVANALQGSKFVVGQNYLEICEQATGNCSEQAQDAALGLRRVLQGESDVFTMEYPCHSPTVQRWFILRVVPLSKYSSTGAVVMHVDITGRKLAEEALRASEGTMAAAQRIAHLGSWEMELLNLEKLDANSLHWSDETFRIAGYEPGVVEPSIKLVLQSVPENEHGPMREAIAAAIAKRQDYSLTHRIIRPNGEERTVREVGQVVFDEKTDQPLKLIGTTQDITERMEVKKQLLWKTAFFEAQVHSAPDGILVVDSKGDKIIQNQRMAELWHIPQEFAEDVDDRRQLDWVTRQVKNPTQFADKVTYLSSHPDEISRDEIDLIDGRCFDRYSAPVRGPDEKYYGRIWTFHDITERMEIKRQLLWKTAFFKAQVHSALDGILVVDPEGRKILQNQRMVDIWGVPAEFADELDDKRQRRWAADQTTNPQQFLDHVVYLNAHPDEISRDEVALVDGRSFDRYSAPVRGSDGTYYGRIWTVRDISKLKRSEARFRRLVDSNAQGVIFWSTKGEITGANEAFLRLTGFTRDDLKAGQVNWKAMTPPEYAGVDRLCLEKVAVSGVCAPYEKEYIRKDGSRVPVLIGAALFEDSPEEGVCFVVDLTESKKLEQQFLRAQRMESIGTLAGGIAHDLNNILAPIMMSIDILKTMSENPKANKILETIEVSAKRGADIVRQVLSFARGVEGERVEVQLKHLVKDIESIIKDTFPKDIRLRFSLPRDLWTVLGDATQVHQILLNLCVNARDAMPHGGNLTIDVENCILDEHNVAMNPDAKAGHYVNINVTDTGTGIPPKILERIFEPFFTTKAMNKGTGLGLSTVMAIVKSHGGIINVYSEPGKGTTFKVYLPAMEMSSAARMEQLEQASLPRGNGETILLVDDEASILTITSQTLQAFGYHILTATDGADAVAVYAEHKNKIAVVLTDMAMPIMDGAATVRALLRMNPTIKIIAASGLTANADITKASGGGIKHFLTKPYTAGTLLKTLRTILDQA